MRRKNNYVINGILLIILLVLLLFALVFVRGRDKRGLEGDKYSGKWVGIAEIKEELSFGIYAEEDWDAFFSAYGGDELTQEALEQLLVRLDAADYIDLPENTKKHTVTREEWNLVYGQILDLLDMEREVQKQSLLVLDRMETTDGSVLITSQGDYDTVFPVSFLEQWQSYECYVSENRCLGIAGVSAKMQRVDNAYLKEYDGAMVTFLYGGGVYQKEIGEMGEEIAPGVCDFDFVEGEITSVRVKRDIIEGELLSFDDTTIEIAGYGKVSHPGKIPVYQAYGEVAEKSLSDVVLGNMKVEYVTGENQVCAILIRQPADIADIRVLLLAENGGNFRDAVYLKSDVGMKVKRGTEEGILEAGAVANAAEILSADPAATLMFTPENENGLIYLCTADGTAVSNGYAGTMEVRAAEAGYTVVNCLPFETYLAAVVPSEMPSSYAPEALKTQAVCARSYAYIQLLQAKLAEYGAHVNDSTSYQVYNKVPATPESKAAVAETAGQILTYGGAPVEAYYFSTSMGYTDTAVVWNQEGECGYLKSVCLNSTPYNGDLSQEAAFLDYIKAPAAGYDSDMKYYRWFAAADYRDKTETINEILLARRGAGAQNIIFFGKDGKTELTEIDMPVLSGLGKITEISVQERSSAGAILTLLIRYEKGSVQVKTEYNIRKVLGCGLQKIVFADTTEKEYGKEENAMLPSAFCAIVPAGDGTVTLSGGGYGHGLGMSQNAANGMAKAGMNYEEILHYFYNEVKLEVIGT